MIFNLKRAASLHLFAAAILVAPFFASCDNEDIPDARVVFMTGRNGSVITEDTIAVKIGGTAKTYFGVTYHFNDENLNHPYKVLRQYDNNEPEDLSPVFDGEDRTPVSKHDDFSQGESSISSEGYGTGKCTVRTAFSKKFVHVGSVVKISVSVGNDAYGELCYKVEE